MEETHIVGHEQRPTPDQNRDQMREYFETLMKRRPVSMVITAEFSNGDAATSAVGPPAGLVTLARLGVIQVIDMLGRKTGENG